MLPIFISGICTGVGKTLASAIITEALHADYWKPVQAGYEDGTDALRVKDLISNFTTNIHPEVYKLQMPASPHLAARKEGIKIDLERIRVAYANLQVNNQYLIIEGAGGLMVPLNDTDFITDLITCLQVPVILVSQNYLGSINHSLLSAAICKQKDLNVLGWIFNGRSAGYEQEIAQWSGYPILASIPEFSQINKEIVEESAKEIRIPLLQRFKALNLF